MLVITKRTGALADRAHVHIAVIDVPRDLRAGCRSGVGLGTQHLIRFRWDLRREKPLGFGGRGRVSYSGRTPRFIAHGQEHRGSLEASRPTFRSCKSAESCLRHRIPPHR